MDRKVDEKTEIAKLIGEYFRMRPRFLVSEEDIMKLIQIGEGKNYYQILKSEDDMWCSIIYGTTKNAIDNGYGGVITLHKEF